MKIRLKIFAIFLSGEPKNNKNHFLTIKRNFLIFAYWCGSVVPDHYLLSSCEDKQRKSRFFYVLFIANPFGSLTASFSCKIFSHDLFEWVATSSYLQTISSRLLLLLSSLRSGLKLKFSKDIFCILKRSKREMNAVVLFTTWVTCCYL